MYVLRTSYSHVLYSTTDVYTHPYVRVSKSKIRVQIIIIIIILGSIYGTINHKHVRDQLLHSAKLGSLFFPIPELNYLHEETAAWITSTIDVSIRATYEYVRAQYVLVLDSA